MKHQSIQSLLRSFGGTINPAKRESDHKILLRQQLLRADYFDVLKKAERQTFWSWVTAAAVPVVSLGIIVALVLTVFTPLTARDVLARAGVQLASIEPTGSIHYTKRHMTTSYNGITDDFNDVTIEMWENNLVGDIRIKQITSTGEVLAETITHEGKAYACTECLAYQDPAIPDFLPNGTMLQPGGPLEKFAMEQARDFAEQTNEFAIQTPIYGGGPLASGRGSGGGSDQEFHPTEEEMADNRILSILSSADTLLDPVRRFEFFQALKTEPRVVYAGKKEWRDHDVHVLQLNGTPAIIGENSFYFDAETFALIGVERTLHNASGLGPFIDHAELYTVVFEFIEDSYTDDASLFTTIDGFIPAEQLYNKP